MRRLRHMRIPGSALPRSVRSASRTTAATLIFLTAGATDLPGQDDYRTIGSPEAPLEMTVYSDFECPYCRNFALAALPAVVAEFADRGLLRIRFAYFPLAAIHKNAVSAAKAAHCAGEAGRFWAYHDYLFVRQPEWAGENAPDSLWVGYAANLGLPRAPFSACFAAAESDAFIEADLRQALLAGATGTPTVVLDGESISGLTSYEELRRTILAALARKGNGSSEAPPRDD